MDHVASPPTAAGTRANAAPSTASGKAVIKKSADIASDVGTAVTLLLRFTVDVVQTILTEPARFILRLAPGSDASKARGLAAAVRRIASAPSADGFLTEIVADIVARRKDTFKLASSIVKKLDKVKQVKFKTTSKTLTNKSYKADIKLLEEKIGSKIKGSTPQELKESIIDEIAKIGNAGVTNSDMPTAKSLESDIETATQRLNSVDVNNLEAKIMEGISRAYAAEAPQPTNVDVAEAILQASESTSTCGCSR